MALIQCAFLTKITTMTALAHATYFPAMRATQPARQIAHIVHSVRAVFHAWSQARRQERAERALWSMALADPRVMTDLTCALSRHGD